MDDKCKLTGEESKGKEEKRQEEKKEEEKRKEKGREWRRGRSGLFRARSCFMSHCNKTLMM